jgi:amino acid transporter
MILAAVGIAHPTYVPQNWHTFLLTSIILVLNAVIASLPTRFLARFNEAGALFNLLSLLLFCIIVPSLSVNIPKTNSTRDVWGTLTNTTEWPDGVAVLMSFLGVIWTMSGYDAPFHLSEECSNANVAAPWAIVMTSAFGGIVGWFVILVIGYTVKDVGDVFSSGLGQPMGSYLLQVLGERGALSMLSLIIICSFLSGQGSMIVSSRLIYAYSRDDVLPGSQIWSQVHPRTKTPVYAGILPSRLE